MPCCVQVKTKAADCDSLFLAILKQHSLSPSPPCSLAIASFSWPFLMSRLWLLISTEQYFVLQLPAYAPGRTGVIIWLILLPLCGRSQLPIEYIVYASVELHALINRTCAENQSQRQTRHHINPFPSVFPHLFTFIASSVKIRCSLMIILIARSIHKS